MQPYFTFGRLFAKYGNGKVHLRWLACRVLPGQTRATARPSRGDISGHYVLCFNDIVEYNVKIV
jgi:hypothetical protein